MADQHLLVEGPIDVGLCRAFIAEAGRDPARIKVTSPADHRYPAGGKSNVLSLLPGMLKNTKLRSSARLGVVVDADWEKFGSGATATRNRIANIAVDQGYTRRAQDRVGALTYSSPATGSTVRVWIFPNNVDDGNVEDALVSIVSVPEGKLFSHARTSTTSVPVTKFARERFSKATLFTFLAWQTYPGMGLSPLIKDNLIDKSARVYSDFIWWLGDVFA